jgi:hypothetical protein
MIHEYALLLEKKRQESAGDPSADVPIVQTDTLI